MNGARSQEADPRDPLPGLIERFAEVWEDEAAREAFVEGSRSDLEQLDQPGLEALCTGAPHARALAARALGLRPTLDAREMGLLVRLFKDTRDTVWREAARTLAKVSQQQPDATAFLSLYAQETIDSLPNPLRVRALASQTMASPEHLPDRLVSTDEETAAGAAIALCEAAGDGSAGDLIPMLERLREAKTFERYPRVRAHSCGSLLRMLQRGNARGQTALDERHRLWQASVTHFRQVIDLGDRPLTDDVVVAQREVAALDAAFRGLAEAYCVGLAEDAEWAGPVCRRVLVELKADLMDAERKPWVHSAALLACFRLLAESAAMGHDMTACLEAFAEHKPVQHDLGVRVQFVQEIDRALASGSVHKDMVHRMVRLRERLLGRAAPEVQSWRALTQRLGQLTPDALGQAERLVLGDGLHVNAYFALERTLGHMADSQPQSPGALVQAAMDAREAALAYLSGLHGDMDEWFAIVSVRCLQRCVRATEQIQRFAEGHRDRLTTQFVRRAHELPQRDVDHILSLLPREEPPRLSDEVRSELGQVLVSIMEAEPAPAASDLAGRIADRLTAHGPDAALAPVIEHALDRLARAGGPVDTLSFLQRLLDAHCHIELLQWLSLAGRDETLCSLARSYQQLLTHSQGLNTAPRLLAYAGVRAQFDAAAERLSAALRLAQVQADAQAPPRMQERLERLQSLTAEVHSLIPAGDGPLVSSPTVMTLPKTSAKLRQELPRFCESVADLCPPDSQDCAPAFERMAEATKHAAMLGSIAEHERLVRRVHSQHRDAASDQHARETARAYDLLAQIMAQVMVATRDWSSVCDAIDRFLVGDPMARPFLNDGLALALFQVRGVLAELGAAQEVTLLEYTEKLRLLYRCHERVQETQTTAMSAIRSPAREIVAEVMGCCQRYIEERIQAVERVRQAILEEDEEAMHEFLDRKASNWSRANIAFLRRLRVALDVAGNHLTGDGQQVFAVLSHHLCAEIIPTWLALNTDPIAAEDYIQSDAAAHTASANEGADEGSLLSHCARAIEDLARSRRAIRNELDSEMLFQVGELARSMAEPRRWYKPLSRSPLRKMVHSLRRMRTLVAEAIETHNAERERLIARAKRRTARSAGDPTAARLETMVQDALPPLPAPDEGLAARVSLSGEPPETLLKAERAMAQAARSAQRTSASTSLSDQDESDITFVIGWFMRRYDLLSAKRAIQTQETSRSRAASLLWVTPWAPLMFALLVAPFVLAGIGSRFFSGIEVAGHMPLLWYFKLPLAAVTAAGYAFIAYSALRFVLAWARPGRTSRRTDDYYFQLLLPRGLGAICLGLAPVMWAPDGWELVLNMADGKILLTIALLALATYTFLYAQVYRTLRGSKQRNLVGRSASRTRMVYSILLVEALLAAMIVSDLIGHSFAGGIIDIDAICASDRSNQGPPHPRVAAAVRHLGWDSFLQIKAPPEQKTDAPHAAAEPEGEARRQVHYFLGVVPDIIVLDTRWWQFHFFPTVILTWSFIALFAGLFLNLFLSQERVTEPL